MKNIGRIKYTAHKWREEIRFETEDDFPWMVKKNTVTPRAALLWEDDYMHNKDFGKFLLLLRRNDELWLTFLGKFAWKREPVSQVIGHFLRKE